jgi:hypothetical protein
VAVVYFKKLAQQSCLEGEINDMKIQFVPNWPGYFEFLILMSILQWSVVSGILNMEGIGNVQT